MTNKKKGTQTTLIDDLIYAKSQHIDTMMTRGINLIIERAEKGDYHDLKSELPMPKVLLHRDCELVGLEEIAKKAFDGSYDEL